jgi:hypothetical protein
LGIERQTLTRIRQKLARGWFWHICVRYKAFILLNFV